MFSESSVEELWSKAESLLGPVHCLVNNAGVSITIAAAIDFYHDNSR